MQYGLQAIAVTESSRRRRSYCARTVQYKRAQRSALGERGKWQGLSEFDLGADEVVGFYFRWQGIVFACDRVTPRP